VAQLVEGDHTHARACEGVLEALAHLGGVEDVSSFGVAEDEIPVVAVARALVQRFELMGEPCGHRDRPAFVGLGGVHPPAREVVGDADAPHLPVDVQPLQRQQLALAQAGERGGQVQRPLDGAEGVLGYGVDQLVQLGRLQEADALVEGAVLLRAVHLGHRVALRPAPLDREREDAVQEVQVVLDGLRGQALLALALEVSRDARRVDLVDRPLAEERHEMPAQVPAVVLDRGVLALHDVLQVIDVGAAGLLDGSPGRSGNDHVALDPLAQLLLSLRTCQPVRIALGALEPELALHARTARPPRAIPADTPGLVRDLEEPPTAV
jgi:hypothetical protein